MYQAEVRRQRMPAKLTPAQAPTQAISPTHHRPKWWWPEIGQARTIVTATPAANSDSPMPQRRRTSRPPSAASAATTPPSLAPKSDRHHLAGGAWLAAAWAMAPISSRAGTPLRR
jgi:hypothetical protein